MGRFDGASPTTLARGEPIERGVSYWVYSDVPRVRTLVGPYDHEPPAAPPALAEGLNVLAWPRLDALRVDAAFSGLTQAWAFDSASSAWLVRDFAGSGAATNLVAPVAPGSGLWAFGGPQATFAPAATADQDVVFYHADHLDSATLVTDLAGNVVAETAYYPFGMPRNEATAVPWWRGDYRFTGKERDRESGLCYYGARYYEPVLGKFVSADPLYVEGFGDGGDPQRLGLYTYVRNNPVNWIDPTGLEEKRGKVVRSKPELKAPQVGSSTGGGRFSTAYPMLIGVGGKEGFEKKGGFEGTSERGVLEYEFGVKPDFTTTAGVKLTGQRETLGELSSKEGEVSSNFVITNDEFTLGAEIGPEEGLKAGVGVNFVSFKGQYRGCLAGICVTGSTEVGAKAELGFQAGKKIEGKLPLISLGVEFSQAERGPPQGYTDIRQFKAFLKKQGVDVDTITQTPQVPKPQVSLLPSPGGSARPVAPSAPGPIQLKYDPIVVVE